MASLRSSYTMCTLYASKHVHLGTTHRARESHNIPPRRSQLLWRHFFVRSNQFVKRSGRETNAQQRKQIRSFARTESSINIAWKWQINMVIINGKGRGCFSLQLWAQPARLDTGQWHSHRHCGNNLLCAAAMMWFSSYVVRSLWKTDFVCECEIFLCIIFCRFRKAFVSRLAAPHANNIGMNRAWPHVSTVCVLAREACNSFVGRCRRCGKIFPTINKFRIMLSECTSMHLLDLASMH